MCTEAVFVTIIITVFVVRCIIHYLCIKSEGTHSVMRVDHNGRNFGLK